MNILTSTTYFQDKTIHQLFEEQAEKTPNHIAVAFENKQLTYQELNEQSNQLARYIRQQCTPPKKTKKNKEHKLQADNLVALCLDRSLETIVAIMAVLKAGAAYVPINPTYPNARIQYIFEDTKCNAVLTQKHLMTQLQTIINNVGDNKNNRKKTNKIHLIPLDEKPYQNQDNANLTVQSKSTDLVYVIYTSGTTGTPKGVMIEQKSYIEVIKSIKNIYFPHNPKITTYSLTNYVFDIFGLEYGLPLLTGGMITIGDPNFNSLDCSNYSFIQMTPSLCEIKINELKNTRSMKLIIGGEKLSHNLLSRILNKKINVINVYGPTETTIWSASQLYNHQNKDITHLSFGKPFPHEQMYVLGKKNQILPVGEIGELYIGGVGLARGYLNNAKLTSEKFVKNFFQSEKEKRLGQNSRLYKTGDLVRLLSDGNLEYIGRNDFQIKIRGHRVELEEIENILASFPGIKQSAVLARDYEETSSHDVQKKYLVAYYIKDKKIENQMAEEIKNYLTARLPDYMVPELYIPLEKFPLTINGKLDKKSLPRFNRNNLAPGIQYIGPRDEIEKKLAVIWSEILYMNPIGIHENFFLLGGHSIKAIQIVSRINHHFGTDLPINIIFENNTIEKLAAVIKRNPKLTNADISEPKVIKKRKKLSPSPGQKRLLFLEKYEENKAVYNISFAVKLHGHLDIFSLEKSFTLFIARHQALHIYFNNTKKGSELHVEKPSPFHLIIEKKDPKKIAKILTEEANKRFNLNISPLMRVRLLQIKKTEHVLAITLHHIVSDGRSIELIYQELSTCYAAYIHKTEPKLPTLQMQYLDFIQWQESTHYKEKIRVQLDYWKTKLRNFSHLNMPTDFKRPVKQSYSGDCYQFVWDQNLVEKINALSVKNNATLFMTILAAFNILLSRYTSQEDIVIGTPIDNRGLLESENIFGFFVNTLVLRHNLSGEINFDDLLEQVKKNCLDAYTNQYVPFELLVDELKIERDVAYHPIFQVMFVWPNSTETVKLKLPGLKTENIPINTYISKFDLTIEFAFNSSRLESCIIYNTDLYRKNTIQRMAGHLQELLHSIIENPTRSIHTFSLLTEQEKNKILAEWNCPKKILTKPKKIHQLFSDQAQRTPNDVALIYQHHKLTYQELDEKSTQLASLILESYEKHKDFKSDPLSEDEPTFIGICVERSLDMVIGILGILKTGAAYVALDPTLPKERLKFIIEDANCQYILTQEKIKQNILKNISKTGEKKHLMICLDTVELKNSALSSNLNFLKRSSDLAYVIYTSGTTGNPKGVKQTHHNVQRLLATTQSKFHFNKQDIWTLFHACTFDFSVWEMWGCLLYGGRLIIPTHEQTRDPALFHKLVVDEKVTVLNQTPSAFQGFMQEDMIGTTKISTLRYIIFGGEALKIEKLAPWWEKYGDTHPKLINMYGITETTVHTTYKLLKQTDLNVTGVSNIGKPLDDLTTYIVDKYLNLLPIGVPGELLIGNAGLSPGYINQPELTSEKFIASPFLNLTEIKNKKLAGEETRLYKSGDLVRWLEDGNLEYLGRIDNQVKIHGFRIELNEIESVLNKHSDIQQASARIVECDETKQLVAYYVVKKNTKGIKKEIATEKLREYLKARLPNYMLPSFLIALEEMPLTANMKLDFKALPLPNSSNIILDTPLSAQKITKTEKLLIDVWKKVLGAPNIKVSDNFFNVGGDSISSIRIVYAAKEKGLHFRVSDIFQHQTIQTLAKFCDAHKNKDSIADTYIEAFSLLTEEDRQKLPPNIEDAYPQAALQAGMLYHSITSPETAVYLDVFSYDISAEYIDEYFKKAMNLIVQENPVLRTFFNMDDFSVPLQMVCPEITFSITVIDLIHLDRQEQENILNAWIEGQKSIPFDHKTPPLFRIGIHLTAKKEFNLGFAFHHAILDGWSFATFLTKLLQKYQSISKYKDQSYLPSIDTNYKKFIKIEKEAIASLKQQEFWKKELSHFQYTQILSEPGKKEEKNENLMIEVEIPINIELSNNLQMLAKKTNVSLDIVLLCSHFKLLSILSNSDDVTTGVVFNGRPEIENSEKTLGLFLNSIPFRQKVMDSSWEELILAISAKKSHIYPYRHYPLRQMYEDIGSNDLFDMLFYFTNFHVYKELNNKNDIIFSARKLYERTNFPLVLLASVNQENNTLSCTLKYHTKNYSHSQIENLVQYYQKIWRILTKNPYAPHREANLLTSAEINKIALQWNDTKRNYSYKKSMPKLFEEIAQKFPDKKAIIFDNDYLTYQQLNQKSNQLACHLDMIGVKTGTCVMLCIERGLDIIVATLAILKLGAVYVPLDISYPAARFDFILNDTACNFILTKTSTLESSNFKYYQDKSYIFLDKISFELNNLPTENLNKKIKPRDLAYIIYTSGSSGQPKGVMIEHYSLVNLLFGFRDQISFTKNEIFLALTSVSFDISLIEFYLPIICGASCVISNQNIARDPTKIVDTIEKHKVTIMQATPTTWRMLFEEGWENKQGIKILTGGEALPQDLAQKIAAHTQNQYAWNLYGPTETTIWSTLCRIKNDTYCELDYYPIGKPIANTKIFILNKDYQTNPIGVTGELYISGSGLARGYLNKKALTKKYFIKNLFLKTEDRDLKLLNEEAPRLYRTGDLAQWMPDGNIRYIGRIDDQIKVRGHRIEPGEIEFVLLQHEKIKQCAVVVKKNSQEELLVAYLVLHAEYFLWNSKELDSFLSKKLPYFMIPEKFFILDGLPVNQNGKIDKKQLDSQTHFELTRIRHEYIPPTTNEQIDLAKIWMEVLHVGKISVNDHFFDLGGNSILTLRMINKVKNHFQVSLDLRHVIEAPTLKKLSLKICYLKKKIRDVTMQNTISFTKKIVDPIVTLQAKGNKTPLFLVHPVGGGVFYYLPLAKELGNERPIYGIQDPGIEAKDLLFHSLKEMASFYIVAIKRYQPTGPYLIGGSSFGANVAVEMARQLTDQGDKVAFIGLIDGIAKYPPEVINNRDSFDSHLTSQVPYLHDQLPDADIPDLFLDLHWHRQQIMDQHRIPDLTDLKLTLFKAMEIMPVLKSINSDGNLWEKYHPKVLEIYKVPGDHLTMHFEPHIHKLAKIFNTCLDKATCSDIAQA